VTRREPLRVPADVSAGRPVPTERTCDPAQFRRVLFAPRRSRTWLDLADPAEAEFAAAWGAGLAPGLESPYYVMHADLAQACAQAARTLHRMALRATAAVLGRDDLLARFGIDAALWPRLRRSWATEPHTIGGRFDLGTDGHALKLFEYNADSAAALLECAVQTKWAAAAGLGGVGRSAGTRVEPLLVRAFREAGATGRVHLLVDDDPEERYTAWFAARCARRAGLTPRLCVGLADLSWRGGRVVDGDGVPVTTVWKTWAWETVFGDHAAVRQTRGATWRPTDGERPRLSDVLLSDDVRVFEPLWKAIPSNKAILPVLWELFPGHPLLLRAEWAPSAALCASGYARKPIVGRCGENIALCDGAGGTLDASAGRFADRDCVCQELFPLPAHDGYYPLLGVWVLGGMYGGIVVREDPTRITTSDSPIVALRVAG